MRIKPIILGAVLIIIGILGYLYSPNLVSQFMLSFTGTSGSSAMTTNVLQQIGIPPIEEMDKMIHYSLGGLAVVGVLFIVFGIFAKKKIKKQFSSIDTKSNHITEESQEDTPQKSIQILKERLARGEITQEDFLDLKKLVE